MRVALLTSSVWLQREWGTLRRLRVGLIDERVHVVRIMPEGSEWDDEVSMTRAELVYQDRGMPWVRDWHLSRLAGPLAAMQPDVLHAMDGTLCRPVLRLGHTLGIGVVVGIWSKHETLCLKPARDTIPVAYAAASQALADRCRARVGGAALIEHVPPGVFIRHDEIHEAPIDTQPSICFAVLGDGEVDEAYEALLDGIARMKSSLAGSMFFFHSTRSDPHHLWRSAERRGLLDCVSMVPLKPGSEKLLIEADVLLLPQASGQVQTLVLEAMAVGRAVIAVTDPMIDFMSATGPLRLIDEPTPEHWARALHEAHTHRRALADLGRDARDYVARHHRVSVFVNRLCRLYEKLTEPQPLPFDTAAVPPSESHAPPP